MVLKNNVAPTGLDETALPPVGAILKDAPKAVTGNRLTNQPFTKNPELLRYLKKKC